MDPSSVRLCWWRSHCIWYRRNHAHVRADAEQSKTSIHCAAFDGQNSDRRAFAINKARNKTLLDNLECSEGSDDWHSMPYSRSGSPVMTAENCNCFRLRDWLCWLLYWFYCLFMCFFVCLRDMFSPLFPAGSPLLEALSCLVAAAVLFICMLLVANVPITIGADHITCCDLIAMFLMLSIWWTTWNSSPKPKLSMLPRWLLKSSDESFVFGGGLLRVCGWLKVRLG